MQQSISILNSLINCIDKSETNNESDDNKQANIEICDEKYMKKIWSKYESIPNSYHQKTVEYLTDEGHTKDDVIWCASEKVHGANFSLITNGVDVMAGSRTQILDDTKKFYGGWRDVLENEKERSIKAFKSLNKRYKNKIKVIIIYGELFGGLYSHFDKQYLPKKVKAVQKGVYYCPDIRFYAFDIKTDLNIHSTINDEEIDGRLTVKEANEIFKECGFLYAKILKQGTFNELLKFDVDSLQSTIPSLLNLPEPINIKTNEKIDNIAEGIVIRKLQSLDHQSLKMKAKKFLEIEQKQSSPQKKKTKKRNDNNDNLDNKLEKIKENVLKFQNHEFIDFIMRCINDSRLQSVESKIGTMNMENAKKIQGLMMNDVFKELESEKTEIMKNLQKSQSGKIRALIAVSVQIFFKPKLEALQKESNHT